MFDKTTTLAFSGHRTYADKPQDRHALDQAVQRFYRRGYRTFLCGMADGFDLCAAEAVARLKMMHRDVMLVGVVPFDSHRRVIKNVGRYDSVTASTDVIITLSRRYYSGCYYRRDDFMVEHASALVCYCDGSPSGTLYTLNKARGCGLAIENICRPTESNRRSLRP